MFSLLIHSIYLLRNRKAKKVDQVPLDTKLALNEANR